MFHSRIAPLLVLVAVASDVPARADGPATRAALAAGTGSFQFHDARPGAGHLLPVWTFVPDDVRADTPIVFVMHGTRRNGETYRDNWLPHARRLGFILVVPEFSEKDYPPIAYQRGNILDVDGKPNPRERWTYNVIENVFDHVKVLAGNTGQRYYLYGHSAGAQFVHRFALFMPQARYARAIAANAGWYTLPTLETRFPYGLGGTVATREQLAAVLAKPVLVLLGDQDTKRDDPDLAKGREADKQGLVRFERGQFFFARLTDAAESVKTPLGWQMQFVPGVGHSDKLMSAAAADALFAKPPATTQP